MRGSLTELGFPCRIEGLIASQVGNYVNPLVEGSGTVTTPRQYIKTAYGCVCLLDLPTFNHWPRLNAPLASVHLAAAMASPLGLLLSFEQSTALTAPWQWWAVCMAIHDTNCQVA